MNWITQMATNSSDDSGIAYSSGIVELNFGACQP